MGAFLCFPWKENYVDKSDLGFAIPTEKGLVD